MRRGVPPNTRATIPPSMAEIVLLHAHQTKRRLAQNAIPLAGTALLLAGIAVLTGTPARAPGITAVVAGAALMALSPRLLVSWELTYKGHAIRFENNVVFGERLYVDGRRFTNGMLGYRKTLQAVIRTGDGIGDRIVAESDAGLTIFKIRIVAESVDA